MTENVRLLSREALLEHAEEVTQGMLGISYAEALLCLERGELQGTLAESELRGIRWVLENATT